MASTDLEKNGTNRSTGVYVESSERTWTSWLVPIIAVANIVVFIIVMYINNCPAQANSDGRCVASFLRRLSFQPLIQNPLLGPSYSTLLNMGGLEWRRVVYEHQWWRLLTAMWLHAGLFHLIANMLFLIVIGIRLEQQFGFVKVGLLYLLSGFGGSILSTLFLLGNEVSVGASGALFGLLGAMLSELLVNWTIYSHKAATLFTLLVIISIELAIGLLPTIDNFAHIGGFLVGLLLGFVLLIRPRYGWSVRYQLPEERRVRMRKYMPYQQALFVIGLLLLIAGFGVAIVMLLRKENGNKHCSWCHYLDCVPTSRWRCDA